METMLKIIEDLYEDRSDESLVNRIRDHDPNLQKELEAHMQMKAALDARPKQRPDLRTVEAVLEASSSASTSGPSTDIGNLRDWLRRRDRAPLARRSVHLRSAGVATATLIVFLGIMTVWTDVIVPELSTSNDARVSAAANEPRADGRESGTADDRERAASDERARAGSTDNAGMESEKPAYSRAGDRSFVGADSPSDAGADSPSFAGADNSAKGWAARPANRWTLDPATAPVGDLSTIFLERGHRGPSMTKYSDERRPSLAELTRVHSMLVATPASETAGSTGQNVSAVGDKRLVWDASGDIMEVSQDIERIRGGVALDWDLPSVPLEMIRDSNPDARRPSNVHPAGTQRVP